MKAVSLGPGAFRHSLTNVACFYTCKQIFPGFLNNGSAAFFTFSLPIFFAFGNYTPFQPPTLKIQWSSLRPRKSGSRSFQEKTEAECNAEAGKYIFTQC